LCILSEFFLRPIFCGHTLFPCIDLKTGLRHDAAMVALNKIDAFAREVAEKFRPEKIVLFGSYAHGQPTEDSDVDLLVVMNHKGKASEQALAIRKAIRRSFPLDLIVRTPRETKNRLNQRDVFITSALTKGRTLYERAD
jgi:predicted nucleotidyltransferase